MLQNQPPTHHEHTQKLHPQCELQRLSHMFNQVSVYLSKCLGGLCVSACVSVCVRVCTSIHMKDSEKTDVEKPFL